MLAQDKNPKYYVWSGKLSYVLSRECPELAALDAYDLYVKKHGLGSAELSDLGPKFFVSEKGFYGHLTDSFTTKSIIEAYNNETGE